MNVRSQAAEQRASQDAHMAQERLRMRINRMLDEVEAAERDYAIALRPALQVPLMLAVAYVCGVHGLPPAYYGRLRRLYEERRDATGVEA